MQKPPVRKPGARALRASDLRGVAQLATQATLEVTRMAEGVHQAVRGTLGMRGGKLPGQTSGIPALVYQCVQGVTQFVGKGVDALLARLQPLLELAEQAPPESRQREAVVAALNGVLGDRLVEHGNPLATPMTLRLNGHVLGGAPAPDVPAVTGKVLLLIHGLCMNDLQWHPQVDTAAQADSVDYGAQLAQALGYTPVYLRYNTGLHTSQNGRALAAQLEALVKHWPVAIQDISVLAHSMGGLVMRSAVQYAREDGAQWPRHLKHIVFLGTPHHGAPLERAGNWVDTILGSTPYTRPFAKLGQLRSAGITDLRYGHVLDADWLGHDRFRRKPDSRVRLPLPEGVACFTVAATLAGRRSTLAERLVGDGLVPLHSALGQHDDPTRTLAFARNAQHVAYHTHHMELLDNPAVLRKIQSWLTP